MTPSAHELPTVVRRFVEDAGNTAQSLGVGRVLGQIYGYLYLSPRPRSLADLENALGISKGSASMGVRQLEQWNAVRKIWVRGDRKDYYEANEWLGEIVRNILRDMVGSKLSTGTALLDELKADIGNGAGGDLAPDRDFVAARLQHLRDFHAKAQKVWNSSIVRMLLK
ncbi:MAG: hypothetical protein O3B24_07635 [Verrucomicrobia bacterium]|nr:hypothetical protein [Verrucomicrobiota bacterium]